MRAVLGWKPLSDESRQFLANNKRCIMVYPHTSYFDFVLYLAYLFDEPDFRRRARVLINPQFTDKYWSFVRHVGAIRSTRREDKNGGATKKIIEELSKMDEYIFLISPKGTLKKDSWRSGYYHLAKSLKCPIVTAGFDYEKKEFVITDSFSVQDLTLEETTKRAQDSLYSIVPYHPDMAEYDIRKYDPSKVGFVTWQLIFIVILLVFFVVFCLVFFLNS